MGRCPRNWRYYILLTYLPLCRSVTVYTPQVSSSSIVYILGHANAANLPLCIIVFYTIIFILSVSEHRVAIMAPAKIVFGGGSFMSVMASAEQIQNSLAILKQSGVDKIDTGFTYGDSEACLGRAHASSAFAIDTKNPGGLSPDPSVSTKDGVLEIARQSLARLQTDQV